MKIISRFLPARRYAYSVCLRQRRVCLSVCPSVCHSRYCIKTSWFLHHLITPWFHFLARKNSQRVTPSAGDLWGGYERAIFVIFWPISPVVPKRCKIWPRLLLNTNRKSHTRFRLVPKSMTLDDPELTLNGHYAFFTLHKCLSEPTSKMWMKIDLQYQQQNVHQRSLFLAI